MHILVTGSSGFIGRSLCAKLKKLDQRVSCLLRRKDFCPRDFDTSGFLTKFIDTLDENTDFTDSLSNIDIVIHLAGKASDSKIVKPASIILGKVNFKGTENLAKQAAMRGVKRFVFISSINVNGKSTCEKRTLTEKSPVEPYDDYTVSKYKAESALRDIEKKTGMEVVILRPPLVYGPGVKGNFLKLLNWVHARLPLPFSGIKNKRSFIYIENLIEALILCAMHENAGGQTFLVSDDQILSTPRLLSKISLAMNFRPRLFFFPISVMRRVLTLMGKKGIYERLCLNSVVDSTKIRQILGWQPKVSTDDGIYNTVQWYLEKKALDKHRKSEFHSGAK